jgi:hypothetical protein
MYIHYPAVFKRHELVHGPLLEPTNEAQQKTFDEVTRAKKLADGLRCGFKLFLFAACVRHNLNCAGLICLPVSIIESPADLVEPYSKWRGYEYLIRSDTAHYMLFQRGSSFDYSEPTYADALQAMRRLKLDVTSTSDILVLDDAINVCINQIDKLRMRQRKRRETV